MKEKMEFVDKYLRTTDGIEAKAGLTAFDELQRAPGASLVRDFETVKDVSKKELSKYPNHVLTIGAAVGLDQNNNIVHYYSGRGIKFVGFLIAQTRTKAVFQSRGSAFLKLEGVTNQDRGQRVYCNAPNSFSLKPFSINDAEIGKVRFMERANYAAVAFKSENDSRPLNLKLT